MRRRFIGVLACSLIFSAESHAQQVATDQGKTSLPACGSSAPIIVIDGVVQPPTCVPRAETPAPACASASSQRIIIDGVVQAPSCEVKPSRLPACDPLAPLYVVDGVMSCGKLALPARAPLERRAVPI